MAAHSVHDAPYNKEPTIHVCPGNVSGFVGKIESQDWDCMRGVLQLVEGQSCEIGIIRSSKVVAS